MVKTPLPLSCAAGAQVCGGAVRAKRRAPAPADHAAAAAARRRRPPQVHGAAQERRGGCRVVCTGRGMQLAPVRCATWLPRWRRRRPPAPPRPPPGGLGLGTCTLSAPPPVVTLSRCLPLVSPRTVQSGETESFVVECDHVMAATGGCCRRQRCWRRRACAETLLGSALLARVPAAATAHACSGPGSRRGARRRCFGTLAVARRPSPSGACATWGWRRRVWRLRRNATLNCSPSSPVVSILLDAQPAGTGWKRRA